MLHARRDGATGDADKVTPGYWRYMRHITNGTRGPEEVRAPRVRVRILGHA